MTKISEKNKQKKTIIGSSLTPPIVGYKATVKTQTDSDLDKVGGADSQSGGAQPESVPPLAAQSTPAIAARPERQTTTHQVSQPTQVEVAQDTTPASATPTTPVAALGDGQTSPAPVTDAELAARVPNLPVDTSHIAPTSTVVSSLPPTYEARLDADKEAADEVTDRKIQSEFANQPVERLSRQEDDYAVPLTRTVAATDESGQVIYDEKGNAVTLEVPITDAALPDRSEPQPAESETAADDGIEFRGKKYNSYSDLLADFAPQTSDEEKQRQMKRERRNAIFSALGDGLSALSNLFFTTKGAPDQGLRPNLTEAAKKRMDDLREKWQAEKDKYDALMLKGLDMDQSQQNFMLKYYQTERERLLKEQKWLAVDKPKAELEMRQIAENIKKLENDNGLAEATKQERIDVEKAKLKDLKDEYAFKETHSGMDRKSWAEHQERVRSNKANEAETARYHRARERSEGGDVDDLTIYSNSTGKVLTPDKGQIKRAYKYLVSQGRVDSNAKNFRDMWNAVQGYYSNGYWHTRNRDDKDIGPRVDAILGGQHSTEESY